MNARAQLLSRRLLSARAAAVGSSSSSRSICARAAATPSPSSPMPPTPPSHYPRLVQAPSPAQRTLGRIQHFAPVSGGRRGFSELLNLRGGGDKKKKSASDAANRAPPRPPLRPHPISARLPVPESVDKPPYVDAAGEIPYEDGYQVQETPESIAAMRASGLFAARVLDPERSLSEPPDLRRLPEIGLHQRKRVHLPRDSRFAHFTRGRHFEHRRYDILKRPPRRHLADVLRRRGLERGPKAL